jgi:Tol biopolymer transport system component
MRTRGLLVALACVALTGSASAQSDETTPAVVVQQGGHLYAIAGDGSRTVRLTRTRLARWGPALSPDGSSVAYGRDGRIWIARLDGSGARAVTVGWSPAWTADGTTLYFVRGHGDGFGGVCGSIFSVAATGGPAPRITRRTGHLHDEPAVSPDGRRIAFSDWDLCQGGTASPRLRVVNSAGKQTSDLALLPRNGYYPDPEHSSPAWSPDGTRLAYRLNTDLAVADRDGSGERRLVRGLLSLIYEPPAWSPDGHWIAFTRSGDEYDLVVVRPDGTGLRRLPLPRGGGFYSIAGWLPSL